MVASGNSRIRLHFDFSGHATAEDAERMRPILHEFKPHVVAIEGAFGSRRLVENVESFFAQRPTLLERFGLLTRNRFTRGLVKALRGQGISRVFVLERGMGSSQAKRLQEWSHVIGPTYSEIRRLFFNGQQEEAITRARKYVKEYGEVNSVREKVAKNVISNLHRELVQRFPELKSENEIRVLVKYGTAHTPLYRHALRSGFLSVGRSVQSPMYFNPFIAFDRMATFESPKKPDKEDFAKAIVSNLLGNYVERHLKVGSQNAVAYGNMAGRQITLDQFRRISQSCAAMTRAGKAEPAQALKAAMEAEGLKLPRSKSEVHAFLQSRGIRLAFHH